MDYTFIRKRFIPEEESTYLATRCCMTTGAPDRDALASDRARNDIGWGFSYIWILRHYKISAVFDRTGKFKYWYCDVIKTEYEKDKNKYVFTDLLIDVVIEPDGTCRVLDEDELQEALLRGFISAEDVKIAQETRDALLRLFRKQEPVPAFHGAPLPGEILPPAGLRNWLDVIN